MCIFCDKTQHGGKLSRHIKFCHKEEERVKGALELKRKEQLKVFKKFKAEGIYKYNKNQASLRNPVYQREKKANVWRNLLCCGYCQRFIGARGYSRHKINCQKNSCKKVLTLPTALMEIPSSVVLSDDFKVNILSKFIHNKVGRLCCKDETLLRIGLVFYGRIKRKIDKAVQVRKTVRTEMRRLANLYVLLLEEPNITQLYNNIHDLFLRPNFSSLRDAIDRYSTSASGKMKPGLKQNLFYLLKRAAKVLKALLVEGSRDVESAEIERFVEILELWEDYIFGSAQYELNKRRQINLRRPEKLPNENDIRLLRDHVIKTMQRLTEDPFELWDSNRYVTLRDCACTRLTLLNARRGGEAARLTIEEWKDAQNDKWIDKQRLKDLADMDQALIKSLKVTYITGKGNNHLVPIIFPQDTVVALDALADTEVRKNSGINDQNYYLFASTRNSEDHISGWHSLHNVADSLPLKDPAIIKSTSNRHRVSTLFAAMDLSKTERQYFYKHMGHSEEVNKQVYQAPLAMMEITKIGKRLLDIDEGNLVFSAFL